MQDKLIPYSHSKDLHDKCGGPCSLVLPTRMDHNDFDFCEDLITPFYHFLKQFGIHVREPKSAHAQMRIPQEYFALPRAYQQLSIPASWACCCNASNLQGARLATVSGLSERDASKLGDADELIADLLGDNHDPTENARQSGFYSSYSALKKESKVSHRRSSSRHHGAYSPSGSKINNKHRLAEILQISGSVAKNQNRASSRQQIESQ